MREYGGVNTSVKVILILGVMVFVLLYMISAGLKTSLQPSDNERVMVRHNQSPFDGRRAYADVEALCALGPRVSGTPAARQARDHIKGELGRAGVPFEERMFELPGGGKGANIVAIIKGEGEGAVALLGHYDTLEVSGEVHLGANTGASSAALLLELARVYKSPRKGRTILLVFLDAHYMPGAETDADPAHLGAKAFAAQDGGRRVDASLSIAGLGDCYLRAGLDGDAPGWMHEITQNTAKRLGYGRHFASLQQPRPSEADIFRARGIPAGHLQDYVYGGSPIAHNQYWHTAEDTPERVCWQSLQAAGELLYDALATFDRRLDYMENIENAPAV